LWGEVVARRQTGLEKDPGTIRLRHDPPINEDLDVPGALQNVNAMIGVAGVDKDLLILFVPVIYLIHYLLTTLGYGSTLC
jgi:hypothetical protein